jgi:protein O-GlcNAc transferase
VTAGLNQALALHQQGEFDAAERLYRQVLARDPQSVQALNFWGMLLHQTGRAAEACPVLERAVALAPTHAPAWNNLALAQRQLQQFDAALHSTAQAVAAQADYVPAWINHANTLRSLDRPRDAVAACQRALALQPGSAPAHNTLGAAYHDLGEHAQALRCHDTAITLSPGLASAHFNRGVVLGDLQRPHDAAASYTAALQRDPDNAVAWNNLGFVLDGLLRHEDARAHYARAVSLDPHYALAHLNLGTVLDELGRGTEALASFEQAVALSLPGAARPDAHTASAARMGRGLCRMGQGQFDAAASDFAAVAAQAPEHPYVQGHWFDACARAANWAVMDTPRATMPFNALAAFDSPALQLACAQAYAAQACPAVPALWRGQVYRHARPRIAYLSADFHDHATAHLMVEVFELHARAQFEVFAVSFGPRRHDAMRQRLQAAFEHFNDLADATDADIAQWLRTNEIHIAVDLKGYTHQSRPGIFAYRACPVQVNYLGYPGTMGSAHWDYLIGDEQVTPNGCEAFFTEKIVRFRHSYQANTAIYSEANNGQNIEPNLNKAVPASAISAHSAAAEVTTVAREDATLPPEGFVFACFNEVYKITPEVFAVWMRLLHHVPGSVLWLLTDAPTVQAALCEHARSHGIDPTRLCFARRLPHAAHLARLSWADLFLDTLPVNAHTTASDALRAGLPVVTCAGQSFAARVASSLLHAVDLPELVTHNLADYEALALHLATDTAACQALRDKLMHHRTTTPLFDPVAYTRSLESAYLRMVERSRSGAAPEGFTVG